MSLFQRIDTVFVQVKNLEQSLAWYTGTLGLEPGWQDLHGGYASVKLGETALTLARTPEDKFVLQGRCAFNFYVADAEEARAHLIKHGVACEPVQTDGGVKFFGFHDPDGNRLEVCCW